MRTLQIILGVFFIVIFSYTLYVIIQDGWILFEIFFQDIFALNWSGQFNVDFSLYLGLSALWIAWRHAFSLSGILIALVAGVLGMVVFAPYLIFQSIKAQGDLNALLLGENA